MYNTSRKPIHEMACASSAERIKIMNTRTRLIITRNGETLVNLPLIMIIIAAICAPHAAIICALLTFLSGCAVSVEGGMRRARCYYRRHGDDEWRQ